MGSLPVPVYLWRLDFAFRLSKRIFSTSESNSTISRARLRTEDEDEHEHGIDHVCSQVRTIQALIFPFLINVMKISKHLDS